MKTFIFLLMIGVSSSLAAAVVPQQSIETLTKDSSMIFEGTVTDKKSLKIRDDFFTDVTFEITELLKGQSTDSNVTLRYLGGIVDGVGSGVSGITTPKLNERGIYFVSDMTKFHPHPLTGWGQGHFVLKDNGLEDNVENSLGASIVEIEKNGMLKDGVNTKRQRASSSELMARGLAVDPDESSPGITSETFKMSIKNILNK